MTISLLPFTPNLRRWVAFLALVSAGMFVGFMLAFESVWRSLAATGLGLVLVSVLFAAVMVLDRAFPSPRRR